MAIYLYKCTGVPACVDFERKLPMDRADQKMFCTCGAVAKKKVTFGGFSIK